MDLNTTMRYIMVLAQREAAGKPACVEHIYLAVLSLCEKNAKDIARTPAQEEQVRDDLDFMESFIADEQMDVWPTLYLLREALAGKLPEKNIPEPDTDVAGFLAQAGRACEGQQITVSDVIRAHDKAPTPLIKLCYVDYDNQPTSKEDAAARGQRIIRGRLGLDHIPAADATVADVGAVLPAAETILQRETFIPQEEPAPQSGTPSAQIEQESPLPPKEIQEPKQKEEPAYEPSTPANGVVFFDIPAPGAPAQPAAKKDGVKQPKATKPKRKTKIAGLTFRGGPVIAAIQFFPLVLAVSVAILFGLTWLADAEAVDPSWMDFAFGVVIFFSITLILKGITSLLGRRFKPLEIFTNTIIHAAFVLIIASLVMEKAGYTEEPAWAKILIILFTLILIIMSMGRLKILQRQAGNSGHALSTAMLKLYGTPSSIFFEYLLRTSLIPIIVYAIVWIGNLHVNTFWHAAFSIYGFLVVYDAVRVLLQCWNIRYNKPNLHDKKKKWKKLSTFLMTEHLLLGLPELGLFLMWYFNWFPMPVWVIVLYCIYGLFWLLATAGSLITKVE